MKHLKIIGPACLLLILILSCEEKKRLEFKYYPDGTIKEEIEIKDNVATGIYKTYYETGDIQSISYQKKGKLDGLSKTFFQKEIIQSEQFYKEGSRNGVSKFYHENGNIAYVGEYKNGLEIGKHLEFYENDSGNIWNEFEYLIVKGKSEQVKGIKYNKGGQVIESSNWVDVKEISTNGSSKIKITIVNPIYDSLNVTVGDFDKNFNLLDSGSLRTFWGAGHSIEIEINGDTIRGYVNDYKVTKKEENGAFKTVSSFVYFEYFL